MSLSTILSGPDDVIELLQNFQPGPFRRKQPLSNLRNRNGNLRGLILGMTEIGLIKRGWFADTLTKEGQELLNFMLQHKNELEAQLRRMIRKIPVPQGKYKSIRNTHLKSRQKQYSYMSKTTTLMKDTWLGNIAIPETMIEAAKKRSSKNALSTGLPERISGYTNRRLPNLWICAWYWMEAPAWWGQK